MTLVCDYCCVWIETDNRRWPGYCSQRCRDDARLERDRAASERAQRQADARQQKQWLDRKRRLTYPS